ncbi:MAG: 2-amino-4-hydroxy-6-hydroxymethyldihydropteridine diphosphokinase [Candidatus Omnitrophota bacterium]
MSIAYLSLGSNIGKKEANCEEAVRRLQATDGIEIKKRSQVYLTSPIGGPPQTDYLNGVLKIDTVLPPENLLEILKGVEKDMGRKTPAGRDYPRVIDIDILLYDDIVVETDALTIPHLRMHERYFVLRGLCEIDSDLMHPVLGKTVEELYEKVAD